MIVKRIDLEKVKANDCNLLGNLYNVGVNLKCNNKISIGELCDKNILTIEKGSNAVTKEKAIAGNVPVISGCKKVLWFHNKSNYGGNIITITSTGTAGYVWYHDYPIWAYKCNVLFSNDESILNTKYLFYYLSSIQADIYKMIYGSGVQCLNAKAIKNIYIPLLCIEEQQKIVEQLETKRKYIESQKEIIKSSEEKMNKYLNSFWV